MRTSAIATLFLVLSGCARTTEPEHRRGDAAGQASAAPQATVSPAASALPTASAAPDAAAAPPASSAIPATRGSARLVIQHVEAVCIVGLGANGKGHFAVGEDILVETVDPEGAPPKRDFAHCSKTTADGGESKPRLDIWRNCRRDPSCEAVTEPSGERATVRCGRDTVTLEVVEGRTILRGSFGEREVAPYPMRIEATKRERRDAAVDC